MKLRDYPWWRPTWRTANDDLVVPEQITEHGIFETSRLLRGDLMIEVDYNGRAVVGRIGLSINAPNLGRVRDFLSDYSGDSIAAIENLDVDPDRFKT